MQTTVRLQREEFDAADEAAALTAGVATLVRW